ncbi:MAG: hypothetical protein LUQ71_02410, partial [Methanoregula sp.]|nr:hypothetical protein [Methanoregula sp.]
IIVILFWLGKKLVDGLAYAISTLRPQVTLRVFQFITLTLLPVIFLIFIGFTQLYSSNPIFGAKIDDYLNLVLWGFGSGVSSDKILQWYQKYE